MSRIPGPRWVGGTTPTRKRYDRFARRPVELGLIGDLMDRVGVPRPHPRMKGDFPLGLALDYLCEIADRLKRDGESEEREVP